jgi:glycerol-3-phosphate O-acyltransferase
MQDPDADLSQRINAAKALAALDLRGAAGQSSAVSRMTRDELCAEIARIKGMIAAK